MVTVTFSPDELGDCPLGVPGEGEADADGEAFAGEGVPGFVALLVGDGETGLLIDGGRDTKASQLFKITKLVIVSRIFNEDLVWFIENVTFC
jgi:hypothetical protein